MRRFLVIFISFVLLFSCVGFAEGVDLDSLSAYELFELQLRVQEKLYEIDPASGFILFPGTYVVGRDLKAGSYIFSVVEHLDSKIGMAYISFYQSEDDYRNYDYVGEAESTFIPGENNIAQYNLHDGEVIKLNHAVFQYIKR